MDIQILAKHMVAADQLLTLLFGLMIASALVTAVVQWTLRRD